MFIMETKEQKVRENGERMEVSLFSEPVTVPGLPTVFQIFQQFFSVGNIIFILQIEKLSGTEKPRRTECPVPGHPAST